MQDARPLDSFLKFSALPLLHTENEIRTLPTYHTETLGELNCMICTERLKHFLARSNSTICVNSSYYIYYYIKNKYKIHIYQTKDTRTYTDKR